MNLHSVGYCIKIVEDITVSWATRLKHSEDGEGKCMLYHVSQFINNAPFLYKMRKS